MMKLQLPRPLYYNVPELAHEWGVHVTQIIRYIKTGQLKAKLGFEEDLRPEEYIADYSRYLMLNDTPPRGYKILLEEVERFERSGNRDDKIEQVPDEAVIKSVVLSVEAQSDLKEKMAKLKKGKWAADSKVIDALLLAYYKHTDKKADDPNQLLRHIREVKKSTPKAYPTVRFGKDDDPQQKYLWLKVDGKNNSFSKAQINRKIKDRIKLDHYLPH